MSDLPPVRRAGTHELFFSAARRFAYASRMVHRGHDEPVYPRLAELCWQGEDAIARGDMEGMHVAALAVVAELRHISETGKEADRRRDYLRQLNSDLVWDSRNRRARPLTSNEKIRAVMRLFGRDRRTVQRDAANLRDKSDR